MKNNTHRELWVWAVLKKEDIHPAMPNPYFTTENLVSGLAIILKFLVLDDSNPE